MTQRKAQRPFTATVCCTTIFYRMLTLLDTGELFFDLVLKTLTAAFAQRAAKNLH